MVKYYYDAWGVPTIISDTSGIGIASINPFRYRSYYYDTESELYYLQSRYYDPKIGRFITIDDISYLDPDTVNGLNLYAYCVNNPVMHTDPNGNKWYDWLLGITSVLMIVGGVVLIATGAGGLLGGVLLAAGAGSLIGGGVSVASGGSFVGGWVGGLISGAICGVTAGLAGGYFIAATAASNMAMISSLSAGIAISFAGGFGGNLLGTLITSAINGTKVDIGELVLDSIAMGALNVFASLGSAVSTIASDMVKDAVTLDMKMALRILSTFFAVGAEALYDGTSYLYNKLKGILS